MAQLSIDVSDDFQKQFETMLKETALKVIDQVASNPLATKEYLNKKQAAEVLGVSFVTLQKLIQMGLPVIFIENKQLISRKSMNNFMKQLEQ